MALALRLLAVFFFPAPLEADAADYHGLAARLAQGQGYVDDAGAPTAWRPPGYPLMLAGVYGVTGPSVTAVCVVQAVLGAVLALLLGLLAREWVSVREGRVVGVLAACYPGFIWPARVLLSEGLALLLIAGALLLALRVTQRWRWGDAAALGGVLAAGMLVRGSMVFFAATLCCFIAYRWFAQRRRHFGVLLRTAAVMAVAATAVMTPWWLRNDEVFGRFVPIATQSGMALYASYFPPAPGGRPLWGNVPSAEDDPVVRHAEALPGEVDTSKHLREVTLARLAADPRLFFRLAPTKLLFLAAPLDWELAPRALGKTRVFALWYVAAVLLAALGIWRRGLKGSGVLLVPVVAVILQSLLFYGSPRLRLPAELSLIVWSGVAVCFLADRWRRAAEGQHPATRP